MEPQDKEFVEKLLMDDMEFRRAYKAHKEYEKKVEQLEKKGMLSSDEMVEKNRLKKMKLALKDEMERIIAERRKAS